MYIVKISFYWSIRQMNKSKCQYFTLICQFRMTHSFILKMLFFAYCFYFNLRYIRVHVQARCIRIHICILNRRRYSIIGSQCIVIDSSSVRFFAFVCYKVHSTAQIRNKEQIKTHGYWFIISKECFWNNCILFNSLIFATSGYFWWFATVYWIS